MLNEALNKMFDFILTCYAGIKSEKDWNDFEPEETDITKTIMIPNT